VPDISGQPLFLVIDQGTSSTKCFLFNSENKVVFSQRIKHQLNRPYPQYVECDAQSVADACHLLIRQSVQFSRENSFIIHSAGLATQRSTFLFWDKKSGKPVTPALSWQDSRAGTEVSQLAGQSSFIHQRTGVPLSEHFGGPKYLHLTNQDLSLKEKINQGKVWFGPLSAYLTHQFTGNALVDHSIAGRSLLLNVDTLQWDDDLCDIFNVNPSCLPSIYPTMGDYGTIGGYNISLNCVIGDQQAALIGQGGTKEHFMAMNFGTSGSVLMNTGSKPNHNEGLLNNILYSDFKEKTYLTEGSINSCNSLFYWLEKKLDIQHKDMVWDKRCQSTHVSGVLIPGFSGLAAPYWKNGFRSVYYQLQDATADELIRAGMESIGFLVYDILSEMPKENTLRLIPAGGGAARGPLLQFISDMTGLRISHSIMKDRTAFGVYYLLKKYTGDSVYFPDIESDMIFKPAMGDKERKEKLKHWRVALTMVD